MPRSLLKAVLGIRIRNGMFLAPRSGSEVQIRIWLKILPFSHKRVERPEIMLAK
jgi:hypothetical protein